MLGSWICSSRGNGQILGFPFPAIVIGKIQLDANVVALRQEPGVCDVLDQLCDVHSHITERSFGQAMDRFACQSLGRCVVAHVPLDLGGRQLNERLEKITFRRLRSNHVPQFFEYLMAFPPKAKIQEIDAIAIFIGDVPPAVRENGITLEFFWRTMIWPSSWARCLAGNIRVGWKRSIGIAPLVRRRYCVSHFDRNSGRRLDREDELP